MSKVRVAIVGVGNCASSLVQGVHYYRDAPNDIEVPGLMHVDLGGYHISDIEFVAAFDVAASKVGVDMADAIYAPPNCTIDIVPENELPFTDVIVQRGPTLDGLSPAMAEVIPVSDEEPVDVVEELKAAGVDVVVNYLPVGSQEAVEFYATAALEAGCGFVNCMPIFLASDKGWAFNFTEKGLPIVGDDIKSHVGATIAHRVLAALYRARGVRLERTMQLNVGGNTDFENMLDRSRLASKKISKTQAVQSVLKQELEGRNIHIGPSDHVPWLDDRKWAYVRLEGSAFGDVPLNLELKLEVWDSPNSAGVVIDAVRLAKLALDRGVGGPLRAASGYLMKSPPVQYESDEAARADLETFIKEVVDG